MIIDYEMSLLLFYSIALTSQEMSGASSLTIDLFMIRLLSDIDIVFSRS